MHMHIGLLLWRFECCLCCLFFNRTSEADELTYTNSSPVPGCTVCHIPYSDADLPFPVVLTKCQVCRHVTFLYLFLLVCTYVGNGHFHRRFREQGWRSGNLRSGDFFFGRGAVVRVPASHQCGDVCLLYSPLLWEALFSVFREML